MSYFDDVGEFHARFELPTVGTVAPTLLDDDTLQFRLKFLHEELIELTLAHGRGDLAGFLDGLVDLVYVAAGTAHFAGLPFDAAWAEVQRANMAKERVLAANDPRSTRKSKYDVVKPVGWTPPNIEAIIDRHRRLWRSGLLSSTAISVAAK